jgi:hypothetical protein
VVVGNAVGTYLLSVVGVRGWGTGRVVVSVDIGRGGLLCLLVVVVLSSVVGVWSRVAIVAVKRWGLL